MGIFGKKDEKITVIARCRAKSGYEKEVRTLFAALAPKSRTEEGCLKYDVLEDKHYIGTFYTHEEWESEAALDKHLIKAKPVLDKAKALLAGELHISVLNKI